MSNETQPVSPPSTTSNPTPENVTVSKVSPLSLICGLLLLIGFFLPWINILLGITASGFQLQKEGGWWLWLQPILGGLVIISSLLGRLRPVEFLAGLFPFVFLFLLCLEIKGNALPLLKSGMWMSLWTGGLLMAFALRKSASR